MKRVAFPLFHRPHALVELSQLALPRLTEKLSRRVSGGALKVDDSGLVNVRLKVGCISLPLSILGETIADQPFDHCLAVHSPGLRGALLLSEDDLMSTRCTIVSTSAEPHDSDSLGAGCLLEAVKPDNTVGLENYYRLARKRHFSVGGLRAMMAVGEQVNVVSLRPSFPYHCGGRQAEKKYFDTLPEMLSLFGSHCCHGTKVLSRYGAATCVGVRVDDLMGVPLVYWHPSGAEAACLAPLMHSCGTVPIGQAKLEYNGPVPESPLLRQENLTAFLHNSGGEDEAFDCSVWLNHHLFGVSPAELWKGKPQLHATSCSEPLIVHGSQYDNEAGEFDLFLRGCNSGLVFRAADI